MALRIPIHSIFALILLAGTIASSFILPINDYGLAVMSMVAFLTVLPTNKIKATWNESVKEAWQKSFILGQIQLICLPIVLYVISNISNFSLKDELTFFLVLIIYTSFLHNISFYLNVLRISPEFYKDSANKNYFYTAIATFFSILVYLMGNSSLLNFMIK